MSRQYLEAKQKLDDLQEYFASLAVAGDECALFAFHATHDPTFVSPLLNVSDPAGSGSMRSYRS